MRKYITPRSVRIDGLPGVDNNFGVRDNGSGQLWSATKRVGSIDYWTGLAVLDKEYVPKVRFRDALLILLGLKSAARPSASCEYEVTDLDEGNLLDMETITGPRAPFLRYSSGVTGETIAQNNRV